MPAASSPDVATAVGEVASASRWHRGTDRHAAAVQRLKAVKAEEYVRRLVAEAPELTPEQRDRLARILRGAAA